MLDSVYKAAPVFLFALLAGCVAAPVKHALPVTEPLPLRLAVEMTPEQLARRTQYFYYYYLFCSEEGLLTQRAALAAFTPLVSQVLPREQMPVPDVIVKVSSKGLFNPLMRVFYADVSATAYLPNGAELGTF
ncbi:MAG: hypothetical protein ACREUV_07795, partial [Burkholderiales bacterium]